MVQRTHLVQTSTLTGKEIPRYFTKRYDETFSQKNARDERSMQEIIDEEGFESISLRSQIYNTFQ